MVAVGSVVTVVALMAAFVGVKGLEEADAATVVGERVTDPHHFGAAR
jgi:hypothetical protein